MTTAFSATLIVGPEALGINSKMAVYKLQMPNPTVGSGSTCDVSGSMQYVRTFCCNVNDTVTELAYKYSIIGGTYSSTYMGFPASTVKIVAHRDTATNAAFTASNSADLSGADTLIATFIGC